MKSKRRTLKMKALKERQSGMGGSETLMIRIDLGRETGKGREKNL